jgi:hypothetical protein
MAGALTSTVPPPENPAGSAMELTDFCGMPLGKQGEFRIALCPRCNRHGRVQGLPGGGRVYDHVARAIDPAVAGVRLEILEWCEVPDSADW